MIIEINQDEVDKIKSEEFAKKYPSLAIWIKKETQ